MHLSSSETRLCFGGFFCAKDAQTAAAADLTAAQDALAATKDALTAAQND